MYEIGFFLQCDDWLIAYLDGLDVNNNVMQNESERSSGFQSHNFDNYLSLEWGMIFLLQWSGKILKYLWFVKLRGSNNNPHLEFLMKYIIFDTYLPHNFCTVTFPIRRKQRLMYGRPLVALLPLKHLYNVALPLLFPRNYYILNQE